MKHNGDLQLTLMASSLYRPRGSHVGNGYQFATADPLFRGLVDATAQVTPTGKDILVRFPKPAHTPLLLASHFKHTQVSIPWPRGRRLRLGVGERLALFTRAAGVGIQASYPLASEHLLISALLPGENVQDIPIRRNHKQKYPGKNTSGHPAPFPGAEVAAQIQPKKVER